MRARSRSPEDLHVQAPNGRWVYVCAVPRGQTLREVQNGSGDFAGDLAVGAINVLQFAAAQFTKRWIIGVLSVDEGPWGGRRRFHVERVEEGDVAARMRELVVQVETGQIVVPPPRGWRLRRKISSGIAGHQ
ncbi:hypothetical protein [Allobranchiibius huperziae]|uniref:Uncharacterized protein n=1 Tax=Allobranchiibius huperziae TaxID=1874116 RepID=A0A853DDV8_9MICO|nr:hypothetical protein [Allobranchiibius huperziae]NYJ75612.1 hypothetical protein [Allobranchiibius huperziae]